MPPPARLDRGDLSAVRASLVIVPCGALADRILTRPVDRDLLVADPARLPLPRAYDGARHPYGFALGDRLGIGYGKLTIYLGSVAGSGKTYAMLDRAHQLLEDGVDVVASRWSRRTAGPTRRRSWPASSCCRAWPTARSTSTRCGCAGRRSC